MFKSISTKYLIAAVFALTSLLVSPSRFVLAQETDSEENLEFVQEEQSECSSTAAGETTWGEWQTSEDGLSRTRTGTYPTFDVDTQASCGDQEVTQTEYAFCVEGETLWAEQQDQIDSEFVGQCTELSPTSEEVLEGNFVPTPTPEETSTPTPDSSGSPTPTPGGDSNNNGSDNNSNNTTSTGQVLGATTLADAGDFGSTETSFASALMFVGSITSVSSMYAFKKKSL